jgi:hypothetical protein
VSEYPKAEGDLDKATRIWNVAIILDDLEEFDKAEERLREAIEGYEKEFGKEYPHTLKAQYGRTPLSWAAGNGYDKLINRLLSKASVDSDLKNSKSGRTPLSWAAGRAPIGSDRIELTTICSRTDRILYTRIRTVYE